MQKQIEELKRKAEQGSQQLQGEVLELQLEMILGGKFHLDRLEPVPKGEHGGDISSNASSPPPASAAAPFSGNLNEPKNWVAGLAAVTSSGKTVPPPRPRLLPYWWSALVPEGVDTFDQVDGVWVTHPRNIIPVAICLRNMLMGSSSRPASVYRGPADVKNGR